MARDRAVRAACRHLWRLRRRAGRSRSPGRARRHRGRADAGQRFSRPAQLGLRRRAALRARPRLRHARRAERAGRCRARAGADDVPRRRLQSLRARTGTISASTRPASSATTSRRRGARRSTSASRRCGASSSRTRSTGCSNKHARDGRARSRAPAHAGGADRAHDPRDAASTRRSASSSSSIAPSPASSTSRSRPSNAERFAKNFEGTRRASRFPKVYKEASSEAGAHARVPRPATRSTRRSATHGHDGPDDREDRASASSSR